MSDAGHGPVARSISGGGDEPVQPVPPTLDGGGREEGERPPGPSPGSHAWLLLSLAISVFALALYLPGIGVGDFIGDDEALDAGVVWEMRQTGDWLFPEFNGEYLPPKPPLFYWAAAAVSKARGRADEVSLRLPSALAGAATVGITVAGAAKAVGVGPAALSGLMLATMPIMVGQSRIGRCDMLLTLVVTACLLLVGPWRGPSLSYPARWLFWSLLGLALLAKGGAGVGLVAVVLVSAALVDRDARRLRELVHPSIAALLIVGGTWYVVATVHWGTRFVDEQIIGENLHHLLGGGGISDTGSGKTPLATHLVYYGAPLFLKMLPWSLALPWALFALRKPVPGGRPLRFFSVWLVAGLAFFTLVSRKSPYYLSPLAPAVAVLAAAWTFDRARGSRTSDLFDLGLSRWWAGGLLGVSGLVWLAAFAVSAADCDVQAVASGVAGRPLISIVSLLLVSCSIWGLGSAARRRHWGAGLFCAVALMAALVLLEDQIDGRLDNCRSLRPFADEVRKRVGGDEPVLFFRLPLPAVALYAERRIPTFRDPDASPPGTPFYLIVPDSLAAEIPPQWLENAETVVSGHGRVFTRRSMGIHLLRIAPSSRPPGNSGDKGDDIPIRAVPGTEEARNPRRLYEHRSRGDL